jgi:hypothetical protein
VRRERERLKLQERLKREKLERMRLDANDGAGAGEARRCARPALPLLGPALDGRYVLGGSLPRAARGARRELSLGEGFHDLVRRLVRPALRREVLPVGCIPGCARS